MVAGPTPASNEPIFEPAIASKATVVPASDLTTTGRCPNLGPMAQFVPLGMILLVAIVGLGVFLWIRK